MEEPSDLSEVVTFDFPTNIVANEVEISTEQQKLPKEKPFFELSDYSNGALHEATNYCWTQTINELEIYVRLPENIKTTKQIKVNLTADSITILNCETNEKLVSGILAEKCRHNDVVWTILPGGKLSISLDKHKELWWKHLFKHEPEIGLRDIDCSRPLGEIPEDIQNEINRIQYDEIQKLSGNPTISELKNLETLKNAWNAEGSPFKGTPFDPSLVKFENSN